MKHAREKRLALFVLLVVVFLFAGPNALRAQTTQQVDEAANSVRAQKANGC